MYKLSYLLLGYMLVDGYFLKSYGANISFTFTMYDSGDCVASIQQKETDHLVVNEEDNIQVIFVNKQYMNHIRCNRSTEERQMDIGFLNHNSSKSYSTSSDNNKSVKKTIENFTKTYEGPWFCKVYTLRDNPDVKNKVLFEGHTYRQHECRINVTLAIPKNDTVSDPFTNIPQLWIYIGIGIIVAIIIIAQTGVILYLKYKTKRMTRLEGLALRTQSGNENDGKRYSGPPGVRKSKFAMMLRRSTNREDESIYETLEELKNTGKQTPPVPPVETIPTLKKKKKQGSPKVSQSLPRPKKSQAGLPPSSATLARIPETHNSDLDITKRPPLPLPTATEPEGSGTLSGIRKPFSPPEEPCQPASNNLTRPRHGVGQASVASELDVIFKIRKGSAEPENTSRGKFVAKAPPPTGKSAILLGLAPGPASKPRPKINPVNTPSKPYNLHPPPKPVPNHNVNPTKVPKLPSPNTVIPPAPIKNLPRPTPATINVLANKPNTVMRPTASVAPMATMSAKQMSRPAPPDPAPKPGFRRKEIYEESEPFYNEDWTTEDHNPTPQRPTQTGKRPPVLPCNKQEEVYEEFTEDRVYDSDEEWTYEPLQQYHIYSS